LIAQSVEPSESEMSTLPMDIDRWLDIDDVVTLRKKQRGKQKIFIFHAELILFTNSKNSQWSTFLNFQQKKNFQCLNTDCPSMLFWTVLG